MSVQEIETAIAQLPKGDRDQVRAWLDEFESEAWDRQIEEDMRAGRLDALFEQANADFEAGRCKPL